MDKDEILKMAQNKKPNQLDEMELDIAQKSSNVGMLTGLIVCLVLMFIKMIYDQPYQDLYAVFCAVFSGQYLYKWFRQREKIYLFCGSVMGICAVGLFAVYVMKFL